MRGIKKLSSSFKDPSGFVYKKNGQIYRAITQKYKEDYQLFKSSGLYNKLVKEKLLIPHVEVKARLTKKYYKVIKPKVVPFISYPYEWSFDQLKAAALATLQIQKIALAHGMILKDANAFNIQFIDSTPIFIDTLSFKAYQKNEPWVAYRQFCTHFLAPLALMKYSNVHLNQLIGIFPEGVPLNITSSLLPKNSWLNLGLATHIHLQSKLSALQGQKPTPRDYTLTKKSLLKIITNLENTITKLNIKASSFWGKYYNDNNYSKSAFASKKRLVLKFLSKCRPKTVWDIGANTGEFSHLTARAGYFTVSMDNDPASVETNYNICVEKRIKNCLPLLIDITSPTPALGWGNNERDSLTSRGPADAALALALIHHLAIGKNIPFEMQAQWFSEIANNFIVEFIPKEDSQIKRILSQREDVFEDYTKADFEKAFGKHFRIIENSKIKDSLRSIYLMTAKKSEQ